MTFRDDLRRISTTVNGKQKTLIGASFRGVPFLVDESDRGGGRRTVKHEFPLRNDPFYEDLGRKARTFRIQGYVLGDDYVAKRDALLAALEDEEGPGKLLHPYHGERIAICDDVSVRETKSDGGIATFSINFCETPTQSPAPTAVDSSTDKVSTSADAANTASDAELGQKFSTSLPSFALASAETAIRNAAAALKDQLGQVIADTQEAAQLTGQVALITAETSALVRDPATILGKFRDAIDGLQNTILAAPGAVMNALLSAYGADLGPLVTGTTATRQTELANQTVLTSGLRLVFAIEAARLAPVVPYVSMDQALAARDQLTSILDDEAAIAGDTLYPALVDLRAQVQQAVPGSSNLARVVTATRVVPVPSLVLAYQLYGDVDLEDDIIARNGIMHPGFVTGDLKVLSDG